MKTEETIAETTPYPAAGTLTVTPNGNGAAHPGSSAALSIPPGAARGAAPEIAPAATRAKPGMRQMVSALRHRNYRLFWTGQIFSLVGTWMQMIARAWLVYELAAGTGQEGFWLGMVGLASSLPVLLLSLYAGVIVDRVSKWRILVFTQVGSMLPALLLAALTFTGRIEIWHVLAISLLLGAINAFDAPARQAFVSEMVGKEDLMNAVALNSTVFNLARVLGPAVAGVVLAVVGPALCFLLNGVSYIAVLIGLYRMRLPQAAARPQEGSSWNKLREGMRYIKSEPTVRALLVLVGVNSFFGMSYSTLAPIFADSVLGVGQQGYGLLMAAAGLGALFGAVNLTFQSGQASLRRGRIILIGSALFGLALCGFAFSTVFPLSLALLLATGWAMISQNATSNTVIQTTTPDHLRGRVMSVYALLFLGVAPMGSLLTGFLADLWGAPTAMFLNGVICFASALLVWRRQPHLAEVK